MHAKYDKPAQCALVPLLLCGTVYAHGRHAPVTDDASVRVCSCAAYRGHRWATTPRPRGHELNRRSRRHSRMGDCAFDPRPLEYTARGDGETQERHRQHPTA